MGYEEALAALKKGKQAQRKLWDSWVEQRGKSLHFILSPDVVSPPDDEEENGDGYTPTPKDRGAKDWAIR